jgi:glycosyltransferase involved in cell wall biosynthesis
MNASVVICTKNRPAEVIRCLESIASQTLLPQEIVIVDASDTSELAKRLDMWSGRGKSKILYIRSAPGLTRQRNVGVKASSGEVVFFFDDDIVLEKCFIEEIVRVFENDVGREIGGVTGDILNARERRMKRPWWQILLKRLFFLHDYSKGEFRLSGFGTWPHGLDKIQYTECLPGGDVAYRREVLEEFSFDEQLTGYAYLEDMDFSYRVSRKYRNVYTPFARCRHMHSQNEHLNKAERKKMLLANHAYLFRKNMPQTLPHKVAFWLSIVGLRWIPLTKYYVWRVTKAIKGELPWTKRKRTEEEMTS